MMPGPRSVNTSADKTWLSRGPRAIPVRALRAAKVIDASFKYRCGHGWRKRAVRIGSGGLVGRGWAASRPGHRVMQANSNGGYRRRVRVSTTKGARCALTATWAYAMVPEAYSDGLHTHRNSRVRGFSGLALTFCAWRHGLAGGEVGAEARVSPRRFWGYSYSRVCRPRQGPWSGPC